MLYESLTSDHPSYTTTPMWFWGWSYKRGSTVYRFAGPHEVSQIFFANEACSSSFSFADWQNAFDFMISVMSFCAPACSDRVSASLVMDWTVFCLFSSAVISSDSVFRFTPLADFALYACCCSRYSVYFQRPLAAADRSGLSTTRAFKPPMCNKW